MKTYDFLKAKQLISENAENLVSASLGMHEDWAWTAETIWENGNYKSDFPTDEESLEKHEIAGINGSTWATPTIELIFKDGEEKMHACYKGKSSGTRSPFFKLGVLSQLVQDNITPLS